MTDKAPRQGDVLVVPVTAAPELAPKGELVPQLTSDGVATLAHGEATGHHHSIHRGAVMFRDDGSAGGTFVRTDGPALLEHQEHTVLTVPPGLSRVVRQRVMISGFVRRVVD